MIGLTNLGTSWTKYKCKLIIKAEKDSWIEQTPKITKHKKDAIQSNAQWNKI